MKEKGHNYIMKVASSVILKAVPKSHYSDGSYLSILKGKIEDPSGSKNGRKKWITVEVVVRVIVFQVPGFRPVRLITTILDPDITAKEIAMHYHKRWDIEIAYDEIKTHQCATLRGQAPTNLRSKRADFVEQELFSLLITYNLIRSIIGESSTIYESDPLTISFLESLQIIIEAVPFMTSGCNSNSVEDSKAYMFKLIANSPIDRSRRPRCNPRVVKVKMSNFKRKRRNDKSVYRNFEKDLQILHQQTA
jgi:hypothetical protein